MFLAIWDGQRNSEKSFEIKKTFLIERILDLLELDEKENSKSTPVSKPLLHKEAEPRVKK